VNTDRRPLRIEVVCTGNICRSPLAHRLIEKRAAERGIARSISVESSGTGAWHVGEDADSRMRRTAARHGLDLHHRSRQMGRDDLESADIVLAMSPGHVRELRALARRGDTEIDGKLLLLRQFDPAIGGDAANPIDRARAPEVPDPYYDGDDGFERVFEIVNRSVDLFLDYIEERHLT
jgi:protein-tyrosine phosphatase